MDIDMTPRRHNPVDSICRKLQTIQRRDREPNSPFQIPRLQSNSYDSPHTGLRCNLDVILKKSRGDAERETTALMLTPGSTRSSGATSNVPVTPITPVNATYTITGTLGTLAERNNVVTGQSRAWQLSCSTPAVHNGSGDFSFTPVEKDRGKGSMHGLLSCNLNLYSSDASNILDNELVCPALVGKRLSMSDGASFTSEFKKESMAEVSLICEEDLLDTIFQACDTQCRGKVYVSHIVDYLRHTTSRTSEDSGLEELCNMLDPEHKDISIDLDTYHAIMKEWIEDCRNQVKDGKEDLTQESIKLPDSLSAKRSTLLNMTSGSLEAFGGEASRAELETSDLVFCVADLQFNNQKLQEEVRKMKQAMEAMEETNQKLIEENEELKTRAKMGQQLLQKERMLKEEVEEMKLSLSSSEESKAQATAQSKQMERENQTLVMKIASLQDENTKVSVEMDELQKKIKTLYELNADLQAQTHSFDVAMVEKETLIQEKTRQIEELKAAVMEYSSVMELLRAEKSKLESQLQLLQPDMAIPGLSLSVAYRLNQTSSGSLETELALAQQNSLEGPEHFSSICMASPLDETLDREVLFLLQNPTPEQMSLEFKILINKLRLEFEEDSHAILAVLQGCMKKDQDEQDSNVSTDLKIQGLQFQLEQRHTEWSQSLEQLKQYTESLENELVKMASNLRRSRTEILHLSVRVQEQEVQKQQLCDELDLLKTWQNSKESSSQTADNMQQAVDDLDDLSPEWGKVYPLLDSPTEDKPPLLEEKKGQKELDEEELQEGLRETGHSEECHCEDTARNKNAPHDSGEAEQLECSVLSQKCRPESITDPESCGTLFGDENVLQNYDGPLQKEGKLPECIESDTHEQAVCCKVVKSASLSHSHLQSADESAPNHVDAMHLSTDLASPRTSDVAFAPSDYCEPNEPVLSERSPQKAVVEKEPEGKDYMKSVNNSQELSQDQISEVTTVSERIPLLPVAEEEESMAEASQKAASVAGSTAATVKSGETVTALKAASSAEPTISSNQTKDDVSTSPNFRNRFKKELETPSSVDSQDSSDASVPTEKDGDNAAVSDDGLTQSEKEIEAEFQRLSLSQRCDLLTLEKRLRLEERSRILAEENVRKEVTSCQGLLQALIPLCGEDNQAMEIIQRLQKNLDILIQSMTRVASRSEMLGAINQEARMGKAVEVMIQHVENLRRTYTKEHTELLELRENQSHNKRSFGSKPERADKLSAVKKPTTSQLYKVAAQRVNMAASSRNGGGLATTDMTKVAKDTEAEKLSRHLPRNLMEKGRQRLPLKRFFSSGGWAETDNPALGYGFDADSHLLEEQKEVLIRRRSSLTELGVRITSLLMPAKTTNNPGPPTEPGTPVPGKAQKTQPAEPPNPNPCSWLAILLVLAGFLALLSKLLLQPAVNAAPVGTGDSWMTIQQILWPFTGLRHNGRPPV